MNIAESTMTMTGKTSNKVKSNNFNKINHNKINIQNLHDFCQNNLIFCYRFDNANAQLSTFTQFLHPDYSAGNTNNDVCLLKLDTPFNFTSGRVAPVSLNQNDDWNDESFTVTGWGTTSVIVFTNKRLTNYL